MALLPPPPSNTIENSEKYTGKVLRGGEVFQLDSHKVVAHGREFEKLTIMQGRIVRWIEVTDHKEKNN